MPGNWIIDQRMLRWWGKEKGWTTQEQIAVGLGVAPSTLSRAVSGKSAPGEQLLAAIRLVFGKDAFADICRVVSDEVSA